MAARSTASASETAPEDAAAMHYVGESIEEFDPAMVQAEKRTQAALLRLNYYDTSEALARALAMEALPSHKVLVLVDAQTSKPRIGVRLVEMAASIMARGGAGGVQSEELEVQMSEGSL